MRTKLVNGVRVEVVGGQLAEIEAREANFTADVPQVVEKWKAMAALDEAGHLATVEALMANPSTPSRAKHAWNYATTIRRTSPFVSALAPLLGMDDAALDALFIAAAAIE